VTLKNQVKKPIRKIVLAYSGGLDTSVILAWLKEHYAADVVACYINVGQRENITQIRKKAFRTGASAFFAPDARLEYVKDYIWPALQARAVYESKYLLGTSLARPLIAQKVIEVARQTRADAVCHGSTGKGNDQVRFELAFGALAPDLHVIAPWREWDFEGRQDLIDYARGHNIPVPVTKAKPYSSDENLWHISHEGGILEDLSRPVPENVYAWTVHPSRAPSRRESVEIGFESGKPISLNGRRPGPIRIIEILNRLGGKHGIGRVDLVENRLVGMKSRGIYESPAAAILYAAHFELESLALDRETLHAKNLAAARYGELVYYGLWFSPLRKSLAAFVKETQKHVTGRVRLGLAKGQISVLSRHCAKSLYSKGLASFEKDNLFDQKDATGFIRLFGLPLRISAQAQRN
jgi:argininosuccinate synthase